MPKKHKSFRETLRFYLIDCKTPLGKFIDGFIMLLNLLIVGVFVLETYPLPETFRDVLWEIELVVVAFFILEYIARIYAAKNRIKHVLDIYSIIDLVAIIPTIITLLAFEVNLGFLLLLRVFRVFRVLRFLRFVQDQNFFFGRIRIHLLRVSRLLLTIFLIFFVGSGLFFQVENVHNPGINNFGDAFYFTVVTLTTVGFGDITPVSGGGKAVTVLMILSGIILIPWQASRVIKEWLHIGKRRIVCPKCGLSYHDKDASHCKACGHIIYQEYDGD